VLLGQSSEEDVVIDREVRDGTVSVTFSLPASEGEVSVVGPFNDWDPEVHRLTGEAEVLWVTVELATGMRHEFRYLAADGCWFDEPDSDGHDGDNSVILLGEQRADDSLEAGADDDSAPGGSDR
jgi:hypothetical protein